MKNIPAGATLGVEASADGPIEILLLDAEDYARFSSPARPVLQGKTSEETADEFATVLIVMLDQKERLRAQAEFFHANASILERIAKDLSNARHPPSGQRARDILRWSEDSGLVRRWQPIFVPHMQTPVLERLRQAPTPWTDLALIEKELAARR